MRLILAPFILLLALSLGACAARPQGPTAAVAALANQTADGFESGDGNTTVINQAVSRFFDAKTPRERAMRAACLIAGVGNVWMARLKYGSPEPQDFNLALGAFSRFQAISGQLRSNEDSLWINSDMNEIAVQVGLMIAGSLKERGIRAVAGAFANPLSLLSTVKDLAIQGSAAEAAVADIKAMFEDFRAEKLTEERIWNACSDRVADQYQRLAGF